MMKERMKNLNEKKLVRKEFQVGQKVLLYKSRWKRLLGKWKAGKFGPFIVNKVLAYGVVEIKDPGDSRTCIVKGNKLRTYVGSENASEKFSLILSDP